jgi:hypothetical protein
MNKNINTSDRSKINFEKNVRTTFIFLIELGFSEIEALPTLVRFRKGEVEVDIYHGRQSYEIGAGVTVHETRYPISEIIRCLDPVVAKQFFYTASTTPEGVLSGLEKLSKLMQKYAIAAIEGKADFLSSLEKNRIVWAEEYELDVLTYQLRPLAEEAFRVKDYKKAAELYSRIHARLHSAELKKLEYAERNKK